VHSTGRKAALFAAILLTLSTVSSVQAGDPKALGSPSPLVLGASGEDPFLNPDPAQPIQPLAGMPSPDGCYGRSDLPHMSGHNPGSATAQGNTICRVTVPRIRVESYLYKEDCFLFYCWWSQVDAKTAEKTWFSWIQVNPAYACPASSPTSRFKIDTYSEVTGRDNQVYSAWTTSTSGQLPCD